MARSSPGGQSSARIAAFFRGPARMRPKTFPCYQNASPAPYNTYRVSLCFLAATLFVFRPSASRPHPAWMRAHIRMSAPSRRSRRTSKLKRKGQRKCASCADSRKPRTTLTERIETKPPVRHHPPRRTRSRATAPPPTTQLTQRQPRKATAFAFLPPGKPPEACTVTSVRVFARRGGAAGVEAKCLHGLCRHSRPSPCKESGAGHLSARAAKPALRPRTTHRLPPSKNAASRRGSPEWKGQYITSVRVFARRGGAAGVEAKCLHGSVQAFAAVALRRRWCAGRDLNPHERTAH